MLVDADGDPANDVFVDPVLPFEFLDQTSLLGSKERIADKMVGLSESGVTTLTLSPFTGTLDERIATLRTGVEALELSGVGS